MNLRFQLFCMFGWCFVYVSGNLNVLHQIIENALLTDYILFLGMLSSYNDIFKI